jgi:hypothetical protein
MAITEETGYFVVRTYIPTDAPIECTVVEICGYNGIYAGKIVPRIEQEEFFKKFGVSCFMDIIGTDVIATFNGVVLVDIERVKINIIIIEESLDFV